MNIHNEPRAMIEYIIDKYFVKSIENRQRFFFWFDPLYYYQKINKKSNNYSFYAQIDVDKFEKDMFESYSYFFYEYYTKKYLVNIKEDELSYNDVIDFCAEIIERKNDHIWIDEIKDDFNVEYYIID